jgi:hypothetical protein
MGGKGRSANSCLFRFAWLKSDLTRFLIPICTVAKGPRDAVSQPGDGVSQTKRRFLF